MELAQGPTVGPSRLPCMTWPRKRTQPRRSSLVRADRTPQASGSKGRGLPPLRRGPGLGSEAAMSPAAVCATPPRRRSWRRSGPARPRCARASPAADRALPRRSARASPTGALARPNRQPSDETHWRRLPGAAQQRGGVAHQSPVRRSDAFRHGLANLPPLSPTALPLVSGQSVVDPPLRLMVWPVSQAASSDAT